MKCNVHGASYHLHEAEQTYQDLIDRAKLVFTQRYAYQHLSVLMAEQYLKHQRFAQAASVLSDASADLDEYISRGWVATMPLRAPVSMIMIIWRLYVLRHCTVVLSCQ